MHQQYFETVRRLWNNTAESSDNRYIGCTFYSSMIIHNEIRKTAYIEITQVKIPLYMYHFINHFLTSQFAIMQRLLLPCQLLQLAVMWRLPLPARGQLLQLLQLVQLVQLAVMLCLPMPLQPLHRSKDSAFKMDIRSALRYKNVYR